MTYLNLENKTIQYEKNENEKEKEELVEIDETQEEIENLSLDEVREIIKERIGEITNYHYNYE